MTTFVLLRPIALQKTDTWFERKHYGQKENKETKKKTGMSRYLDNYIIILRLTLTVRK